MALLEMNYYSDALKMTTTVNVLLPEKPKKAPGAGAPEGTYKTLYLYHGLTGDHTAWLRKSCIERYAAEYGIAVVMPEVGRSWYTDTRYGANYFTFVTEELPQVCRSYFKGMSDRREDNLVAGLSMGGYGAVKAALCCPEKFFGCASLSGSLDISRKGRPTILEEWQGIFNFDLEAPAELEDSEHDLFAIARKNHAEGKPFPKLYLWCGTEDSLITVNRNFDKLLQELGVAHVYEESQGDHSWKWWDMHIADALACLLEKPEK